MKLSEKKRKILEKEHLIKVSLPEEIKISYDVLFGLDKPKEILRDIVKYFTKTDDKIEPHTSYSILGPLGSGKSSLVYATAKASNIPVIAINTSAFNVLDNAKKVERKFKLIFETAEKLKKDYKGCFIMFRNIQELCEYDNEGAFYHNILKYFSGTSNVFLFALALPDDFDIPADIGENNIFTTEITLDYPDLQTREKIFEYCIKKNSIVTDADVIINRLAKETLGNTPQQIEYIVKEALLFSKRQNHSKVSQNDFSETILKLEAGEKDKKMTDKERKLTAYHEAGHVIAGYFSTDDYVLSRVEISPRSQGSLGLTITEIDENKYTYFRKDFEQVIIECYGGLCAEELIFGSHTSGVSADLAMAAEYAIKIVTKFGMEERFGPYIISSGKLDSQANRALADECAKNILQAMYLRTQSIIKERKPYLEAVANALIEKEVVLGTELEEIMKNVTEKLSLERN